MTRITLEHIDSIFDCSAAITLAAEILDGGRDIPAALAESIRRVLLNSQNQLYPVWDVLEKIHSEQENADAVAEPAAPAPISEPVENPTTSPCVSEIRSLVRTFLKMTDGYICNHSGRLKDLANGEICSPPLDEEIVSAALQYKLIGDLVSLLSPPQHDPLFHEVEVPEPTGQSVRSDNVDNSPQYEPAPVPEAVRAELEILDEIKALNEALRTVEGRSE
ncbi:hypothetical protein MRS76_24395 [Rhizobiaceae bacterium n13]|uniref:hypothetical protein n=1 Tax=Ferirhizobium litorale TaxID=2927786 RepID=UPI0024B3064A|nr:hypothetical protein [Fererhizobium litorale]MDI7865061.1 hypothetical protein [Fererhizobium litorale]